MRHAVALQRGDDDLGLRRRHDPVLESLQHDHRRADAVGVVDRRALAPQLRGLGPGPDEPVVVARLELVGVVDEAREVRDAVVVGAGGEHVGVEGQRAQHGPAARAAAGDRHPRAVDLAGVGQRARGVDRVVGVHDAPLAAQPVAVLAPVARAAAVVDVDDGEAAAGEELDLDRQPCGDVRRRAAVDAHHQRRALALRRREVRVVRRIEQRVRAAAAGRRVVERARDGDVGGVDEFLGVAALSTSSAPVSRSAAMTLGERVPEAPTNSARVAVRCQIRDPRQREGHVAQRAGSVDDREVVAPVAGVGADDAPVGQERVPGLAERPQRSADLGLERRSAARSRRGRGSTSRCGPS